MLEDMVQDNIVHGIVLERKRYRCITDKIGHLSRTVYGIDVVPRNFFRGYERSLAAAHVESDHCRLQIPKLSCCPSFVQPVAVNESTASRRPRKCGCV